MATTWRSLGGQVRLTRRLAGEVAMLVVLVSTLAFSWSDSTPSYDPFASFVPIPSGIASMKVSANNLHSGKRVQAYRSSLVALAPAPHVLIPSARPVQLLIPSLNVHRAVEAVGVDRFGVMNLPANSWNAGWYKGGPVPGAPGDAVIEGHAGYPGQPMIFGRLVNIRPGDRIVVVLSDGTRLLFAVESKATIHVGLAPPGMAEPYGPPRLTLITCTGHFDQDQYSYSDRLVVEASFIGLA